MNEQYLNEGNDFVNVINNVIYISKNSIMYGKFSNSLKNTHMNQIKPPTV